MEIALYGAVALSVLTVVLAHVLHTRALTRVRRQYRESLLRAFEELGRAKGRLHELEKRIEAAEAAIDEEETPIEIDSKLFGPILGILHDKKHFLAPGKRSSGDYTGC